MKIERIKLGQIINPTEKQQKFLDLLDDYKYILYGGAMGGGKSYILRWSLVGLLLLWYARDGLRNVTVGLFCEDYPSLNDRHISKIEYEFPTWLGTLNKSSHEFIMNPKYGGGKIAMRNLDEPSKYVSAEFAGHCGG